MRRDDTRPFVHLYARYKRVAPILRPKDRSLAFFHVEPVLTERGDNVWVMRDEDGVSPCAWHGGEHFSKCLRAAIILVRRYDKAALGEIRCFLYVFKAGKYRGFVGAVVLA